MIPLLKEKVIRRNSITKSKGSVYNIARRLVFHVLNNIQNAVTAFYTICYI